MLSCIANVDQSAGLVKLCLVRMVLLSYGGQEDFTIEGDLDFLQYGNGTIE